VVRSEQMRNYRPEAPTLPFAEELTEQDLTEVNVHVEFDPDD
jgi:hypothetical protein